MLASLGGALWTLWERSRQDPWLRLLRRACKRLRPAGFAIDPNSPPRRVAQLLAQQLGVSDPRARAIGDWLLRLETLRYAPVGTLARVSLITLQRELNRLPWPQ